MPSEDKVEGSSSAVRIATSREGSVDERAPAPSKRASTRDSSQLLDSTHGASAAGSGNPAFGFGVELVEQNGNFWSSRSSEERQAYIEQLDDNYHEIVNDFLKLASSSVDEFKTMVAGHMRSRRRMIALAGILAMLNIVLAFVTAQTSPFLKTVATYLPVLVALYSAFLAICSNWESLENHLQRAQHYRQARESSLNAFRELEMLWHVYVRPFSDTPTACVNAAALYRRAVAKDQEVRGQVMEKSESRAEAR